MPEPIRIIAWGNRGRCDDGVALILAEKLEARFADDPEVSVQQYHQLGPELADDLGRCRLAIFIDAHVKPEWEDVAVEPVQPCDQAAIYAHHFPPPLLLALTRSVGAPLPPAHLVSIRGRCFEFGDELSPAAQADVGRAEHIILDLITAARNTTSAREPAHA